MMGVGVLASLHAVRSGSGDRPLLPVRDRPPVRVRDRPPVPVRLRVRVRSQLPLPVPVGLPVRMSLPVSLPVPVDCRCRWIAAISWWPGSNLLVQHGYSQGRGSGRRLRKVWRVRCRSST